MSRVSKLTLLCWGCLGGFIVLWQQVLVFSLGSWLLVCLWLGLGATTTFLSLRDVVRTRSTRSFATTVLLPLTMAVLYCGLFRAPGLLRVYLSFPSYRRTVGEWEEARDRGRLQAGFSVWRDDTAVDYGPPLRLAFRWSRFADNWDGVVYDPSGAVLKINRVEEKFGCWTSWTQFDIDDPENVELMDIMRLFQGDMCYCGRLWGSWYYCVFT